MSVSGSVRGLLILVLAISGCEGDGVSDPSSASSSKPAPLPPAEGQLYSGFGNAGIVLSDLSVGTGQPSDVVSVVSSIFIGGSFRTFASGKSMGRWRVEKRDATTGQGASFGRASDLPLGTVTRIAADQDWLYVAGIEHVETYPDGLSNFAWRIEKYRLQNGKRAASFGDNGVLTLDFSRYADICRAIILDGTDLYLIGEDMIPFDPTGPVKQQWRIEKRAR